MPSTWEQRLDRNRKVVVRGKGVPLLRYAHSHRGHSQLGLVLWATVGSRGPTKHTGGRPRKDDLAGSIAVHTTRCQHNSMCAPTKAGPYVLAACLHTLTYVSGHFTGGGVQAREETTPPSQGTHTQDFYRV